MRHELPAELKEYYASQRKPENMVDIDTSDIRLAWEIGSLGILIALALVFIVTYATL